MNLRQTSDIRQTQGLAPRLQYAVRLLQLSSLDYEQELQAAVQRNPFLELDDAGSAPAPTDAAPAGGDDMSADSAAASPESTTAADDDLASSGGLDDDERWEESGLGMNATTRNGDGNSDMPDSGADAIAAASDLRQHLRAQANLLRLSARDHALVCTIVESLDDDGYLRTPLPELAELLAPAIVAEVSELVTALRLVQSLEPAGIGARNVAECLTLQLDAIEPALRGLAATIVAEHLARLAQRDVDAIARLLGEPATRVAAACAALRRLDPRPGWRIAKTETPFIAPDVIVRKVRGAWVARLNDATVPRLSLNRRCAELFARHRGASHAELTAHLHEARWMVRNVEQRTSTILAVAQAILRRQARFFEHGPLAMKPMALRDIAAEVGVHVSTVCRVTNNKYMTTPAGVFELKRFFSRPMAVSGGGACSPTAIRGLLQELVGTENAAAPLSDVDLAQMLARQGLVVARRTVTKYRQSLRIPPVDRRRCHAVAAAAVL